MPPKLPSTYREIHRKLTRLGFFIDRIKGGHVVYRNSSSGRRAVVPKHVRSLPKGTVKAIIREAGIDANAFIEA